jgi:cytochrome P450
LESEIGEPAVEFDPYSEDFWNGAYDTFRRLRDEAPLYRNERRNFYALSRYEDVHEALRDHQTYSSASGVILNQLNTPGFSSERDFPGFIIGTDPPLHTQLRGLVSRSFSSRAIAGLEPAVRQSVRRYLDHIAELDQFDLCAELADRYPAEVMYDLMGVPPEDRARVFQYNEDFNDVGEATAEDVPPSERHVSGQLNMVQYVMELAEQKRAHPQDDLISEIIVKEIERPGGGTGPLEPMEIGGFLMTLLGAGVETTTKLLANLIVAFHRHPDQW